MYGILQSVKRPDVLWITDHPTVPYEEHVKNEGETTFRYDRESLLGRLVVLAGVDGVNVTFKVKISSSFPKAKQRFVLYQYYCIVLLISLVLLLYCSYIHCINLSCTTIHCIIYCIEFTDRLDLTESIRDCKCGLFIQYNPALNNSIVTRIREELELLHSRSYSSGDDDKDKDGKLITANLVTSIVSPLLSMFRFSTTIHFYNGFDYFYF